MDPAASELLREAEAQFRDQDDPWGQAVIGFIRMETALKTGQESTALALGRTSAAAFRDIDDLWGLSAVLYHLGWGLRQFGRYEAAARTLEEAIDVATQAGVDNTVQWALADLGITQLHLGHEEAAADAFRRSEAASQQVGDRAGRVLASYGRGLLAELHEDWPSALSSFAEAGAGFEALGTPVMAGQAAVGLARAHEGLAEVQAATQSYQRALDIASTAGEPALTAAAHEGLARMAIADGDIAAARQLMAVAVRTRDQGHRPASPFEQRDLDRLDLLLAGSA
jgi:tetratricopeptide (TPR) repeat protein